jgi:hypothetical protein
MKRLKINLDCDGLLSNFVAGALVVVAEVTGKQFSSTDVTAFDFTKSLGLSAEEGRAVKSMIGSRQGFARSLPPYRGIRQGVNRLRELGDVSCVTSPWDSNPWWRQEREAWLALHVGIDVVHHAVDKRTYDADLFVDDMASHVRDWMAHAPGRTGVLWRTPHNTSEPVPVAAHSTSSWDRLYEIAREVALGPAQGALPLTGISS